MNLSVNPREMFVSDMCNSARCSPCRWRIIGKQWQIDRQDDPVHAPSTRAAGKVKVLLEMVATHSMLTCGHGQVSDFLFVYLFFSGMLDFNYIHFIFSVYILRYQTDHLPIIVFSLLENVSIPCSQCCSVLEQTLLYVIASYCIPLYCVWSS